MADQRKIARQEQILDEAQKRLERMDRAREQMVKQVEREAQLLDDMLKTQDVFSQELQSMGTTPPLSASAPTSFKSQFDQFNTTSSNERLTTGAEAASNGLGADGKFLDFVDKLRTPDKTAPSYSMRDNSEHWTTLTENPGKPVFVSGRYVETEHGSFQINGLKNYEYELSARALPISVGDVVRVPVHPTGHSGGKAFTTSYLQMQVTDIYSTPEFHPYHDRLEG